MIEKKISIKNIYLLFTICFGLVCLGVGSTYAVFTANAEIESPISLASNLTYNGNLIETITVDVYAKSSVVNQITITNSSGSTSNYTVFYVDNDLDISVGVISDESSGIMNNGDSKTLEVVTSNKSDSDVTVVLGVISSTGDIVLSSSMKEITRTIVGSEISYDNSVTGVECDNVTCMLDYLYDELE